MPISIIIFSAIAGPILVATVYFCFLRNSWVFGLRGAWINHDFELYKEMPSYDAMVYRYWWVWDEKYFTEFKWKKTP